MERIRNLAVTVALAAVCAAPRVAFAVETPFTPFKDGHASSSVYTGNARTLIVRAGDYKAWISHGLSDGAGQGLLKARLQVYVKDIIHDGKLVVWLGSSLGALENQTHLSDLRTKDTVGSADMSAAKHIQGMVDIPLNAAFLKSVTDGSYTGLVLEGAGGLDAELGALEGSHGAILFLDYKAGGVLPESALVDSVANVLVAKHAADLRGATGTTGAAGAKGDKGDTGLQGLQGTNGIKGDKGDAGDSPTLFNLVLDRAQRAFYTFDIFRGLPQTTPDSSGQGNTLTLATNGLTKVEKNPGDSAILFIGGHALAANTQSLNPYREITLSARVRQSVEGATDSQTVISKPNQYELAIFNKRLRVRFKTVLGTYDWQGDGKVDSGWHSVQASYDGSAVRVFVDGAQTSFGHYPNGPLSADTASLYVGARSPSAYGLRGTLDSVRVLAYSVNAQDSLSLIPGRITSAQVIADSVTGFDAKVNANVDPKLATKANLSGASFTGKVGMGTSSPRSLLDVDLTGTLVAQDTTLAHFTHRTGTGRTSDFMLRYGGATYGDGTLVFREDRAGKDFMTVNMLPTGVGPQVVFPTGRLIANSFSSTTVNPTAIVTVEASSTRYLEIRDGATVKAFIDPAGKSNVAYFSQKLGVGDSVPAGPLVVRGGTASSGAGGPVVLSAQSGSSGNNGGDVVLNTGNNGAGGANGNIVFATGGTVNAAGAVTGGERMRINSSGEVTMTGNLYQSDVASGVMLSSHTVVTAAGPQTVFRFLKNGAVYGNNVIVGHLYLYVVDTNNHALAESDILTVLTTGNKLTDAQVQTAKTQPRNTSPLAAFDATNDGGSGAIMFTATKTSGTASMDVYCTFIGTIQ